MPTKPVLHWATSSPSRSSRCSAGRTVGKRSRRGDGNAQRLGEFLDLPHGIPSHVAGATVTIDAMGCQREIARQIVGQKAEKHDLGDSAAGCRRAASLLRFSAVSGQTGAERLFKPAAAKVVVFILVRLTSPRGIFARATHAGSWSET